MPLTEKEKQQRARDRRKADANKHEAFKQRDRDRKRAKREAMSDGMKTEHNRRNRESVANFRKRNKVPSTPTTSASKTNPYTANSSLAKAVNKVQRALPDSPRKASYVVAKIAARFPNTKCSSSKPASSVHETVRKYFYKEDVIYTCPDRKKFVKMMVDGVLEKVPKKYLLFTLKELYALLLQDIPDIAISFTTFWRLVPPDVGYQRDIPDNVCVCKYHENVRLLLKAMHSKNNMVS